MMTGARIPRAFEPVVDDKAIGLGKIWRFEHTACFSSKIRLCKSRRVEQIAY
jgi:hypothetical protein